MEKELFNFYPKDHIDEILKRLNSGDKHIRQSAILEAICYKYFLDKGFKIDIHPVMENNKRPDFIIFNEKVAFYLEAVVIAKNANKLVKEKKAEIINYLNTALVGFKFYVNIIFVKIDLNHELRKKNLKNFIMAKAEEFDISYLLNIEESTLDKYFFKYEDAGWILDVSYIAETDESSENIVSEIVSTYKAKDDEKYVYKSLKKKVTKYGELDIPYVLAACFYQEDNFLGEKDLIDALLGSRAYNKELNTIIRQKNGLWYSDKEMKNTRNSRLSGVLYFDSIQYHSDFDLKPKLFINPWAKKTIDLSGAGINVINFDIKYNQIIPS